MNIPESLSTWTIVSLENSLAPQPHFHSALLKLPSWAWLQKDLQGCMEKLDFLHHIWIQP